MPEANILLKDSELPDSKSKKASEMGSQESGKISKIVGTAKSVTEELANVVDLKVKLVQTDIEDRVNEKVNMAIQKSIGIGLIGIVAFFALVGLALIIGDFLGNSGYGFLSIAGIVLIVTLTVGLIKPRLFSWHMDRVDIAGLISQSAAKSEDEKSTVQDNNNYLNHAAKHD